MSKLVDLMDAWLYAKSAEPGFRPEDYMKWIDEKKALLKDLPEPITLKDEPKQEAPGYYQQILAEKKKLLEEDLIHKMITPRDRIDWKFVKKNPHLITSY